MAKYIDVQSTLLSVAYVLIISNLMMSKPQPQISLSGRLLHRIFEYHLKQT